MKKSNEHMLYLEGLKRRIFFLFLFFLFISALFSQIPLESIKTSSPPKIDGVLDDPVWKKARGYSDFKSFSPDYGGLPKEKTIVYSAYDVDNLYFAFKCFDSQPGKIISTIGKRDTIVKDDAVALLIDSHNDAQNAYFLVMNPLGIQQDGIMDSSGNNDWSPDFIWESNGVKNSEGFVVEVKIPFKTLRFANTKVVKMRIGFIRKINRFSEQYAFPEWKPKGSVLGYLGVFQFEGITNKKVLQFLPAVTYMKRRERNADFTLDSMDEKSLGLTSKIGLTSDLTLDMTLNPDFSHIEIDEGQVDVNLRAEPLLEEKRPFFLEGHEHFKFAGCGDDSPIEKIVHTRNIVEPQWGLKLSGKIGKSDIVNSLFTVDESRKHVEPSIPGEETKNSYYGIFRYKHIVKGDSYVGAIYTGKEFKLYTGEEITGGFNRVGGLDSRIRLGGFITLDTFFLYAFNKMYNNNVIDNSQGPAFGGIFKFENRKNLFVLGYHDLSRNFELAPGRLRLNRNDIRTLSTKAAQYIYPDSDFLKLLILGYSGRLSRDKHFDMNEYSHELRVDFQFTSSTGLSLGYDFATEVYEGVLFDRSTFFITGSSRPGKHFQIVFDYRSGDSPFYNTLLPFQGYLKILFFSIDFHPIENFMTQFTWTNHIFHGDEVSTGDYNINIYRNKILFQFNRYLSLRGIVEYDTGDKKIVGDALLEFTYIPGTVIHLGYGSTFSKEYQVNDRAYPYHPYKELRSSLFFKASYLFRF
jgi:hypothetical protein